MTPNAHPAEWSLMPANPLELEAVRNKCRRLVTRRAAYCAGIAAVPVPGLDLVTDLGMLTKLIDDINREYGLTPEQIDRLHPKTRLVTYQLILSTGNVLVGKIITSRLVARLIRRMGAKMVVKYSAKLVPIAGQLASAAIGFATFRAIGNQHIDACANIAAELAPGRLATA